MIKIKRVSPARNQLEPAKLRVAPAYLGLLSFGEHKTCSRPVPNVLVVTVVETM
jgi:hypothetical protein